VDGGYLAEPGDHPPRWMASGWIQGEALEASLGLLALDEALSLAQDAAEGIAHLHARGIVHRDVSPANVVRTPGGRAVLVDFGQARPWREPAPPSLGVVGTPGFVAPEEVLGTAERSQPAADVFGLGATLYALLTGVAPAGGQDVLETLSGSLGRPVPPRSLGVPLAPELEQALLAALEPRPQERPTAQALLQVLQHVRAQRPLES